MPDLTSIEVRERYGLKTSSKSQIILNTLQHILNHVMDSILDGQEDALHNEHPWLPALLCTVEISILFGCMDVNAVWDLLEHTCAHEEAVQNVRMFTSVTSPVGKIRVWIRLSLLGRSLSRQLTDALPRIASLMGKQSVLKSQSCQLIQLLSALDGIEVKLYVQEKDISSVPVPFDKIFMETAENEDMLDLSKLGIAMARSSTSIDSPKVDISKLKAALRSQTSQRLFYQEECKRLQQKVTTLETELEAIMKSSPDEIAALRISVLEERLKQSEVCREEQRKRLIALK